MYAILGGLGEQGKQILRYLLTNTDEKIVTNDLQGKAVPPELEEMAFKLDPDGERWTHTAGMFLVGLHQGGFDSGVVISCIDPSKNESLAWECIKNKWHYMDLGGDTDVSRSILGYGDQAAKRGIVLASEVGAAPGIISSVAAHAVRKARKSSTRLVAIHQSFGGVPLYPEPPLSYVKSWSAKGLWREYTGLAEFRENHQLVKEPAFGRRGLVYVPGMGVMERFLTSGGLGTTPEFINVPTYIYTTLRHPGHLDYILTHVAHQDDPAAFLEEFLPRVSAERPDVMIFIQESVFEDIKGRRSYVKEVAFWKYDFENGVSAMAQATGNAAGALATMIHDGKIAPGGLPMHAVDWPEWQRRIKWMPDQFLGSL